MGSACFGQNCPFERSRVGDHICDPEIAADKTCCHDKGDCEIVDSSVLPHYQPCPTCPLEWQTFLRDSICDEALLSEECCFDLGDCLPAQCTLKTILPSLKTRSSDSDNRNLMHHLMTKFGGDFQALVANDVGDNVCNQALNRPECYYDGWDCKVSPCQTCNVATIVDGQQRLGNGICDKAYNTLECCYDAGDCSSLSCKTCQSQFQGYLGDGVCNDALNTEECCYDLGDCSICATCEQEFVILLGNKECNQELNHKQCCFDGMDCSEIAWEHSYFTPKQLTLEEELLEMKPYIYTFIGADIRYRYTFERCDSFATLL